MRIAGSSIATALSMMTLLGLFALTPSSVHASMETIDGAPEGFETLEKPQIVSVSLYYGGDAVGTVTAHAMPGQIQFDNPASVVDLIPNIADPAKIGSALGQPLPTNEDKACSEHRSEDCGTLTPDVVAVIYDDRTMSAEMFINQQYLKVVSDDAPRYLPLPERTLSSIYSFNGAVSGMQGQTPDYSLSSDAVHSFGEIKLTNQSTINNGTLRFDTAAASIDRNGRNASAGLFRSQPMQLLSDRDMLGVSYATSDKTLLDSRKSEGNKVIIYLPRRSFVSIYREGRLYSSRAYEAGNQEIDTSELPDGAYNIRLHIEESDGTSRDETRFFAKTEAIPPAGRPSWYAQAGMIREPSESDDTVPQISSHPIVRVGGIARVKDSIGAGVGLLGTEDRAAVESTAYFVIPNGQAQVAALVSSKMDKGVQFSYGQSHNRLNVAVDARKTWMSDEPMEGFEDLSRDITQASTTVSYALTDNTTLGARASFSKDDGMEATTSVGPYAEWRIWQAGENMLTANANAARTEGRDDASILISFSRRFGNYGVSTTAGAARGSENGGPTGSTRVWNDRSKGGNQLLLGGGISGDKRSRTVNADADWKNHVGQVRGNVQKATGDSGSGINYGGNFSVNALRKGGEIHVGGDQSDKSAIIVGVTGDVDTKMKILVNEAERSTVNVGGKQVIYLTPFHTYNIRLVPEKAGMFDYESGNRRITLYPGNVVKEEWSVNKFHVVVATILRADGTPLADAVVKDVKELTATDEDGHLQVEISGTDTLTLEEGNGRACRVELPGTNEVNGVKLYAEPLTCR